MNKPFILGLTGISGSGKTTVCDMLRNRGVAVIDCDDVSRDVTKPGSPCLDELAEAFGDDIIGDDGALKRRALARRAFATAADTARLNEITHPYIIEAIDEMIMQYTADGARAVVLDAPTLFESGANECCDAVAAVVADGVAAKKRVTARDNISERDASARLSKSLGNEFFVEHADFIIYNNEGLAALHSQVNDLIRTYSLT